MKIYVHFLIVGFIVIEIVIIGTIIYRIRQKTEKNVLGVTSVAPLKKSDLLLSKKGKYTHFFELPANMIATESADWLNPLAVYRYNNDGLNDLVDYTVEKPPETYRIIILGDSFTYGMYVSTKDNYTEKLESKLNAELQCPSIHTFEVLNFGIPGYDIAYSVERFNTRGRKYHPDLLMWFIRDDDFFVVNEQFYPRVEYFTRELQATGAAEKYHVDVSNVTAPFELAYKEIFGRSGQYDEAARENATKEERDIYNTFLFSYPGRAMIYTSTDIPESYKTYIKYGIQERRDIFYHDDIDVSQNFRPNDYHPTPLGHEMIAAKLFDHLLKDVLRECQKR